MNLMRRAAIRNLGRLRTRPLVLPRFLSTVTSPTPVAADKPIKPESKLVEERNSSTPATSKQKKYTPINVKLRDISRQVLDSVNSNDSDLLDAVAMLEEGLIYLRDIQVSEGIDAEMINRRFQPSLAEILKKSMDPRVSIGPKSIEDILQFASEHGVSHAYFYLVLAKHYLETSLDKMEGYRKVLSLWVSNLALGKKNAYVPQMLLDLLEVEFKPYSFANLTYFAYLETCHQQGTEPDLESAKKLLQIHRLPPPFFITKTLRELGLFDRYSDLLKQLLRHALDIEIKDMDPNGRMALDRIRFACKRSDPVALANSFGDIQTAAARSNRPITENTINCVMKGYIDVGHEEEVFKIFQGVIKSGITNPLVETWINVLRAMGSPSYVKRQSGSKDKLLLTIDGTVETIVSNGTIMTPKLLSVIVSCYANLDCFEKVEQIIKRFSNEGEGELPLINPLKDNVIIGLLLNGKVVEAEAKLKKYTSDGSGYAPSTGVMNTFLSRYADLKNYKAIEKVMLFMKDNNISEDVGTFTIVIDVFFKTHRAKGLVPDVSTILESLKSSKTLTLNEVTYNALIDGLLKDGMNMEAAREIHAIAIKQYPRSSHFYSTMINGELEWGLIGNAALLFEQYLKKIGSETRMWNLMISHLLFKHEGLALQYYERLKLVHNETGGRKGPNYFTFYFLMKHFVKRGNKDKVQSLIDDINAQDMKDFGSQLPLLLQSLQSEFNVPAELLNRMKND